MNLKKNESGYDKQLESALNAQGGYMAEQMLTRHFRYYINKRKKGWTHKESVYLCLNGFAASRGNSSRYRPSKIKNEKHPVKIFIDNFGRDEFDKIQHDTKHAASTLIDYIHENFGEIDRVFHTGTKTAGHEDDVLNDITGGKKTNADIVVHTRQNKTVRVIGKSIKYSTSKTKNSSIKLFAPTPNRINQIIDDYYDTVFGERWVADKIVATVKDAHSAESSIYYDHDEFLYDTFGNGLEYQKNKKFVKATYDFNKECPLNDHALSYIRLMVAQGDWKAKKFYDELLSATSNLKKRVANIYFEAIKDICEKNKVMGDDLYRELANLNHENPLQTLVIYIKRKDHKRDLTKPDVLVYDVNKSIDDYILNSEIHIIKKNSGTGMFRFGSLKIEADMRPGKPLSRGIINITHDAKSLIKTVEYSNKDWPIEHGQVIAPRPRRRLDF